MKNYCVLLLLIFSAMTAAGQTRRMVVIGSSTAAGLGASSPDSSWTGRFNRYYKYQLGIIDTTHNLGVSGTTNYKGMPTSYIPSGGRPSPDPAHNVTRAVNLLSGLSSATNGVVIVNYPSNGYDNYTIAEIMSSLQLIYDSAVSAGNRCYVTTTQPRSDGSFSSPAVRLKMATLKDSIINRFGVTNSINFWDSLYNPADTTILPQYAADSTHFNNLGHKILFDRVVAKNIFNLPAPAAGDYRSVVVTGLWSDASSWQVYNGSAWVAAAAAPTSSDGQVTISVGDSIRMNTAVTFDQVVVESGAILAIFNTGAATTFTLNDGAGTDILNNGKLYVSVNATLTGAGTMQNNYGGQFILRNQGILAVNTTNEGTMSITGTGNIQNATFTNNGSVTLVNFTLNLNSATLINNDSINIAYNADAFFATTAGTGTFINSPGAVIYKSSATGIGWVNSTVAFSNGGKVKGVGQYNFLNTTTDTGSIAPGNSPGILTVNPSFITGKTPTINLEINSTGAVAGTNYDQLLFSTVNFLNTNVTGATLNVTDYVNDAIGTVYTLVSSPSGSITGPFASVHLSPSLGNLTYTSNSVTVQKISLIPLALTFGDFTATPGRRQVVLHWNTLQELNAAYFIVEHSADGQHFSGIGTIQAKGNSAGRSEYAFTHTAPLLNAGNYYRLKEVDKNGTSRYSATRNVYCEETGTLVMLAPNPVRDMLQVTVLSENINIEISNQEGKLIQSLFLAKGTHLVNLADLPAGTYQLAVFQQQQRIETQRMLKL